VRPWASVYCSLTGLLYCPLWTFQLWPPDAPAITDAFRTPAAEVGTYGRGRTGKFYLNADFHGTFRDLLHAANLRHGTHGFTSLPRIFPPLKIRRLRPGLNPRTWVPEASTLTPRPPKSLLHGITSLDAVSSFYHSRIEIISIQILISVPINSVLLNTTYSFNRILNSISSNLRGV
jgi:hypothetical protein